jgi:hypothetical protein
VASRALDLEGHVHSPTCGHPAVEHDDHTDYLVNRGNSRPACRSTSGRRRRSPAHALLAKQVEDELHHVTSSCCPQGCYIGPVVVSHGCLSSLKQRCALLLLPSTLC